MTQPAKRVATRCFRLTARLVRVAGMLLVALQSVITVHLARAESDDAPRQQFLRSCGTCHAVDHDGPRRQGPPLSGVLGRKVGSLEGFAYSESMKNANWRWDESRLDSWIENPQSVIPGTVMVYRQADPEKRSLVIAYLKSLPATK